MYKEYTLTLENLKIKDVVRKGVTFYKGYIFKQDLKKFLKVNNLMRVTDRDIDVGGFYDDTGRFRTFCFNMKNNDLMVVYVVPFPVNGDDQEENKIDVVNHLMDRVDLLERYWESMEYGY